MNINLANGWGVVRTIADLCLKQPEGKYVLLKDPNKVSPSLHYTVHREPNLNVPQPVIRLYRVPFDAFDTSEEIEDDIVSLHEGSDDGGLGGL